MGTDIHFFAQAKQGGEWVDVACEYEEDRHYLLFAILSGVRNGFGFAGVKTHSPVVPIAPKRGLPEDFIVNDEMHKMPDDWHDKWLDEGEKEKWVGDHSHTWMNAEEVIDHKWPVIARTGLVDIDHYNEINGGEPEGWCGGVSGPNVKVVDESEDKTGATHVRMTWAEDTALSCKYFIDEIKRLKEEFGEVRLVMGFDS